MNTKRIAINAVLTAAALIIFIVELQIPVPVPIPGVKLGLANIITIVAMFLFGPRDAAMILFCRIILGSVFSGNMMALLFSLSGGLLCFAAMCLLRKLTTDKQIWICSILGAVAHNIGQILVAIGVTQTWGVAFYFPMLMVSGIITGAFTGLAAQITLHKLPKRLKRQII